jgi:hypothetical protein
VQLVSFNFVLIMLQNQEARGQGNSQEESVRIPYNVHSSGNSTFMQGTQGHQGG